MRAKCLREMIAVCCLDLVIPCVPCRGTTQFALSLVLLIGIVWCCSIHHMHQNDDASCLWASYRILIQGWRWPESLLPIFVGLFLFVISLWESCLNKTAHRQTCGAGEVNQAETDHHPDPWHISCRSSLRCLWKVTQARALQRGGRGAAPWANLYTIRPSSALA